MSTKANLSIDQGADFKSYFTLQDTEGDPLNLTGYTFQSEFRKTYSSSNVTSFVCTVEQSTNGVFSLALAANVSANVTAGRFVYDVKMTDSLGTVSRVMEGILTLNPEVTT